MGSTIVKITERTKKLLFVVVVTFGILPVQNMNIKCVKLTWQYQYPLTTTCMVICKLLCIDSLITSLCMS